MLDFGKPARYSKKDKLSMEYKYLWRHFIKLLTPVQRFAVLTPWVTYDETLRLLGVYEKYTPHGYKWWDPEIEGKKINRMAVKIRKLKFIMTHLNEDENIWSDDDMKLVPALDNDYDDSRIDVAVKRLTKRTYRDTTLAIPFRYLAYILQLNTHQVLGFYIHFEGRETVREYRRKDKLAFWVRIYDAIKFLKDMKRMKIFAMNKKFCVRYI